MPAEAADILHRAELAGEISADAASLAHADLGRLRVEYFPYDPFAERIWELRGPGLAAPAEQLLDYSYEQQVTMLGKVRRGIADVATSRRRLEMRVTSLAKSSGELERRAREARSAGLPDLAQGTLARKNAVDDELGEVRSRHRSLQEEEHRLTTASQRLQAKMDARQQQQEVVGRSGRPDLTCYEAWYVALAEFLGAKLATLDSKLARVPALRPLLSVPGRAHAGSTAPPPRRDCEPKGQTWDQCQEAGERLGR
jgi:predicted nucleic acid-binding protein